MSLPKELIISLREALGEKWVVDDETAVERYLQDETPIGAKPVPSKEVVVAKPRTTSEVSSVVKLANKYRVPVYPRGGGTGLTGGSIPLQPGIILSLERMDKVNVDADNMVAEVEAGVTLGKLLEEADKHGLIFPAHPGDEGAFVGGLIACNAGGARAVRTGVMRNYVLGIEVVTGTGDVLKLGGKTIKNNMGYNLAHLFIGSEGILGIITKAYIRLYPKWKYTATVIMPFNTTISAIKTAQKILFSGMVPLAMEYFDRQVIELSAKNLGTTWQVSSGDYFLMLILAEPIEESIFYQVEAMSKMAEAEGGLEPLIAQREDEQKHLLKIRSEIFTALKGKMYDSLDTTVPIGVIDKFIDKINEVEKKYQVWIPTYGHVGDGNLHVHIMRYPGYSSEELENLKNEIYSITIELGGNITGEHGIGYARRKYVEKMLGLTWVETMKSLKKALDPNNILNPGKVIPG
ncbi:MAG: FAD-binding oxidoreductase [Desulfurococcaceae archaeon]